MLVRGSGMVRYDRAAGGATRNGSKREGRQNREGGTKANPTERAAM